MAGDGPRSHCAAGQLLPAPTPPRGAGVRAAGSEGGGYGEGPQVQHRTAISGR